MEDAELIKNKLINESLAVYVLTIHPSTHPLTQNIPHNGLRKILIHKSLGKKETEIIPLRSR